MSSAPELPSWEVPKNLAQPRAINEGNLLADVKTAVDGSIKSQIDPLQSLIEQYATQSGRAVQDLNTLYGQHIQPAAEQAAQNLAGAYNQSVESERQIQAAASARLNQLHQQRATDAQNLAQQIGGPVPLEMFLNPVDVEQSIFTKEAQGSLLYSGMLRDAGLAQAEAFSGRVLPLLRAEQTQQTRNFFRDKQKELEGQIATIKGTRKGLIDENLRKRLLEERQFQLEKLKTDREFWLNQKSGELETARIDAQLYGTEVGDANADADRTASVEQSEADRRLEREKLAAQKKANATQYDDTVQQNLVSLANGAFTGGKPQNIYRLIKDPTTLEMKSVQETVSSPGGINPQTGKPWRSKDEVINWIFSQVGVSRNNPRWRAFVKGKIDLMWPAFKTEQNKQQGAIQRFNHNMELAQQMGFPGFPPEIPVEDQPRYLSEWIQQYQNAKTHFGDGRMQPDTSKPKPKPKTTNPPPGRMGFLTPANRVPGAGK